MARKNCRSLRHSSQGECGLKSIGLETQNKVAESLLARGVWIEISPQEPTSSKWCSSLLARGVWIEMTRLKYRMVVSCHSSQGECGLKLVARQNGKTTLMSLLARGVWIEIPTRSGFAGRSVSLLARGVWIEIPMRQVPSLAATSLLARGVWIEIKPSRPTRTAPTVTPRKGSVD